MDQAREELQAEGSEEPYRFLIPGRPEAIPQDKQELARQADAVLRDLFPRIPNTDRVEIILQSFNKVRLLPPHVMMIILLNLCSPTSGQPELQWSAEGRLR